jgi:hypothetical protein
MNERVCERRLTILWSFGAGLVFLLLVIQDIRNVYGDQSERAWSWFTATVLPTLSVMIGTVAVRARKPSGKVLVDPLAFYVSLGLSIVYLGLVLATVLVQPLSSLTPLQLMARSTLYLAPVQVLVGLALGAFFVSRQ